MMTTTSDSDPRPAFGSSLRHSGGKFTGEIRDLLQANEKIKKENERKDLRIEALMKEAQALRNNCNVQQVRSSSECKSNLTTQILTQSAWLRGISNCL